MAEPLVSVVIPSRDRGGLLADATRSALAQTYGSFDVCVVDDGSRPPVRLPPDVDGDPRVRVVRLERSEGAAAARNRGVAETSGELLAFLDDDDLWLPRKLERQVAALQRSAEPVAGVQCGFDYFDDCGVLFTFVPDVGRDLPRLLLERPVIAPSSLLLRRSVFDELGGFDPSFLRLEDWELWLRLADDHTVAALPEVLARRRNHPQRRLAPVELPFRVRLAERLLPRLAGLPPTERREIEVTHRLAIADHRARAGQRGAAIVEVARLWRLAPTRRDVYRAAVVVPLADTWLWTALRSLRSRHQRRRRPRPGIRTW